jgi:D-threo-aldose 1-dehydrogenase
MRMSAIRTRPLARVDLSLSELGFGTATLGNLYRPVSGSAARDALAAGLSAGMGYLDTAPHYGHGLSERRVGDAVRGRGDVVLSTKVGRLLRPNPAFSGSDAERHGFRSPMPFERVYDYTYDGILRSHEDSLQRLGLARIDILFVHDIGRLTHGDDHGRVFGQLTAGGGLKALAALRQSGAIRGFGLGVNEWQVCMDVMDHADLDVILLAGRYTLLEQTALASLLPRCVERGTSVVIGGAYNSGILATGTRGGGPLHYDYGEPPAEVVARVRAIEAICDRFAVTLPAAALQFALAHPAVASVVVGLGSAARVAQTIELYGSPIPPEFWSALRDARLVEELAPVPGERG